MQLDTRFLNLAASHVALPEPDDSFGWRILAEYGAVFATTATPPPDIVFESAEAVERFQSSVDGATALFGDVSVTLQRPAIKALLDAAEEARSLGLSITPRGADAAGRSWGDSESLWRGRVERASAHWLGLGRLDWGLAEWLLALPLRHQPAAVLDLESREIWFSTHFDKSILQSVAAPGTSQHLSLLAFDVAEFEDERVRDLLSRHGWFQTVVSDLPHFTFLGRPPEELPALGLRLVAHAHGTQTFHYWIPGLE